MSDSATSSLTMGAVLIIGLLFFCGFLANVGVFDAIDGRERRTEELHDIQMTEERAQAKARATREALAINQELHNAAIEQERQRLELERERQSVDLYMTAGAAYARAGASIAWGLGIAALALGLPVMGLIWLWNRRRPLLNSETVGSAATAAARVIVDVERSRAYGLANKSPDTLSLTDNHAANYAPKFSNRQDIQGLDQLPAPVAAPSFRQLLEAGKVGEGQPLLLGFTDKAIQGGWGDIYSAAVAGVTGSGKTTTTRFLAAQGALQGSEFAIIDPHAGAGADSLAGTLAPLAGAFRWQPAERPSDILDLVALLNNEIDRRAGYGGGDRPLIVAVDELTALLKRSDLEKPLGYLLERIAQEGRKLKVYGLLCGQIWSASRAGGTELRDSLASAYVHRIKRAQARYLLPTDEAAAAETLPTGAALLYRTSGEIQHITIPNTTARDMVEVGRVVAGRLAHQGPRDDHFGPTSDVLINHFGSTYNGPHEVPISGPTKWRRSGDEVPLIEREATGEVPISETLSEARIRAEVERMITDGASMTATIKAVWGHTGGEPFQQAAQQYKAIRDAIS